VTTTITDAAHVALRDALLAISVHHGGFLKPADVVDVARDPAHMLHAYFTWDNDEAAAQYRLIQASGLIRRVKLTIMRPSGGPRAVTVTTTRAFASRPSQRSAAGGYEAIDAVMQDESKRAELVAHVLGELQAYRRRYAALVELQDVWAAVDELTLPFEAAPEAAAVPPPA
jgi:hypothetical protein